MIIKTTTRRMIGTCSIRSRLPFTIYDIPITTKLTNNTNIATTIRALHRDRLVRF
jgi:hypothetical protein